MNHDAEFLLDEPIPTLLLWAFPPQIRHRLPVATRGNF